MAGLPHIGNHGIPVVPGLLVARTIGHGSENGEAAAIATLPRLGVSSENRAIGNEIRAERKVEQRWLARSREAGHSRPTHLPGRSRGGVTKAAAWKKRICRRVSRIQLAPTGAG